MERKTGCLQYREGNVPERVCVGKGNLLLCAYVKGRNDSRKNDGQGRGKIRDKSSKRRKNRMKGRVGKRRTELEDGNDT